MRTQRELYLETTKMCTCELTVCPICEGRLRIAYSSGPKLVQTMEGAVGVVHSPKRCADAKCAGHQLKWKSAEWQQLAPHGCTYGYDVIAQVGWQRQSGKAPFAVIQNGLRSRVRISETQVRMLYHERYLPLLACQERMQMERLKVAAMGTGLLLSLDGLAPEGGEAQLWVVRELLTGVTVRSGWLAQQDAATFVNFLQPIADLGLPVVAVLSDKQRGLLPAIAQVFPDAKHAFCQTHYLRNAAAPVAEADEAMKVALRKEVRHQIGDSIRQEKVESQGVLTTTGLLPSPIEHLPPLPATPTPETVEQEREAIRCDIQRRIRYLLTLKGRPPLRLAGIEMFERLCEVKECLEQMLAHGPDPALAHLQQGVQTALQTAQPDYAHLRQAADWLQSISALLDPQDKPSRSGNQVRQELFAFLKEIYAHSQKHPLLATFYQTLYHTTCHYASGLFHCYDVDALPRTNNDRESEFRNLNRRLLATTGQKGGVRRLLQRAGAWELIPTPASLTETVHALAQVDAHAFQQERQRVRNHRQRFKLHTRSAKHSQAQLQHLHQRWVDLQSDDTS